MATPANRVFVLYIETPPAAEDDASIATSAVAEVLHEVAKRGCSGFLILPEFQTTSDDARRRVALQGVLGVDTGAPTRMAPIFPYPNMPIAFYSDSGEACTTAENMGIEQVHNVATIERHETVTDQMKQLLCVDDTKRKQMVVFHMSEYRSNHWVFEFIQGLLGSSETPISANDCFVSILRTASRPHSTEAAAAASNPLRPRQSYERHRGTYSDSEATSSLRRIMFSSHQSDRTRCDLATSFNEDAIETSGAYGAMHLHIFMKEMAFRLGFAPKYGA